MVEWKRNKEKCKEMASVRTESYFLNSSFDKRVACAGLIIDRMWNLIKITPNVVSIYDN